MAISTPVSLGNKHTGTTLSKTIALATTGAVSAGEKLFVVAWGASSNAGAITLSGGGLTWTKDLEFRTGVWQFGFFSAPAPAGLAKETTLTATFAETNEALAMQILRAAGVGAVHKTATKAQTGSGKPWEAGEFTTTKANCLILGASVNDAESSTPGAGYTEIADFFDGSEEADYTVIYQVTSGTGTFKPGGELNKAAGVRLNFCIAYEEGGEVARSRRGMVT